MKPIVYYIDPSVPERWRPYLAKGVTAWQKSFEQIGFKNTQSGFLDRATGQATTALETYVTQRYRLLFREYVFSVGPSFQTLKGEIIDADIGFAQEWVKAFTSKIGTQTVSKVRATEAKKDEGS